MAITGRGSLLSSNTSRMNDWEFSLCTKAGAFEDLLLLDFYMSWDTYIHRKKYKFRIKIDEMKLLNKVGFATVNSVGKCK